MYRAYKRVTLGVFAALLTLGALAHAAEAHGIVVPVASSYVAKVDRVPTGLDAKVVDGDQGMWLRVAPGETAVVLDYRGAPYLRFTSFGVEANQNSAMYYLNQRRAKAPTSQVSPLSPPKWTSLTSAHAYSWHEGRLHALATTARAPGTRYVGRWSVPVLVGSRRDAISGRLSYAPNPSIVWFWPIVVLIACVVAAWRLHRPKLDAYVSQALAVASLIGIAAGVAGEELHGRPTVAVGQQVVFGIALAFVAFALIRVLLRKAGSFLLFVISFAALWLGTALLPVLLYGFVLSAVPAFVARVAAVLSLGAGAGLFFVVLV
jgi:hypothetical protein